MVFILAIAAYMVCSIPVAYLVAKWTRGIDLRKFGSGNIGSSNVLAATSKRWALPVAIFDLSKGILAVLAARWAGLDTSSQFVVGIAGIAGHNWPVFLNFRGGRGILTTLGVIIAFSPLLGLVLMSLAYSLAPFKQLSIGVFFFFILLPFFAYYFTDFFGIDDRVTVTAGMATITAVAYIRRLLAGRRSDLAADLSNGELFINRLLFDRDIRDRKAWLARSENTVKALN